MSLICDCPLSEALPDIPVYDCPDSFGQLQKVVFQRLYDATGSANAFKVSSNNITLLASWTTFIAATDATKAVPSPYITNPTFEAGEARTYGDGNEVLGGIPVVIGREATSFTGTLLQEHSDTVAALKKLACEQNLGVYLIDENGEIGALADDVTSPTEYYPIPIRSFFVGDRVLGGFESPDTNAISWSFLPNWSDTLVRVKPDDFNALTDLKA